MKYKDNEVCNLEELIDSYGNNEFSSPFRSTIPLIELVFHNESVIEKLIPSFQKYNCVFEYGTPVESGKGKASCTDLMVYNDRQAFCIEAKRTEPAYPTVTEWANSGNNRKNRELVLSGWISLINKRCGTNLAFKDVEGLPYQMIHRLASACKINENSELMYFCFDLGDESCSYYENCLEKLSVLIDKKLPIKLVEFDIKRSEEFASLEKKWSSRFGKMDLSDDVQQLMIEEKIMDITIKSFKEF